MFGIDWQVAVSLAIVALAIVYLVVRLLGARRKSGRSCGECHSCEENSASGLKVRQIVQIGKPLSPPPGPLSKHSD